jgi:transposase
MRGSDRQSGSLFSYVDLEKRVRADHPLRAVQPLTEAALGALSGDFAALYSSLGPPEQLLRAMLLQAFYSIRSERQLMERLEYDLLFKWFVGLGVDDGVWDHLLEEPRPAAGRRDRGQVPKRGAGAAAGEAVVVERALLG